MDHKELRKNNPDLFKLWVKYKFSYGKNPLPQPSKNYILSIVNDKKRCFVLLEYDDGWKAEQIKEAIEDINIPCVEIMSFESDSISEGQFASLLLSIIKIFSYDNQILICNRTNGTGIIIFDYLKKEILGQSFENVILFPSARRSRYGKELFKSIGSGWEMSQIEEKECLDAMRTSLEQAYFILATDRSRHAFQLIESTVFGSISSKDKKEQLEIDPFMYCWMMISYIRLANMVLFYER